jgi:hypothetical protein
MQGMPLPPPSAMQPRPVPPGPSDPGDAMPTQPRQPPPMPPVQMQPMKPMPPMPPMNVPPSPAVLQARRAPQLPSSRDRSQGKRRPFLQPWMVIVAIILAAAVAGVVIAMSGPDVAVQRSK